MSSFRMGGIRRSLKLKKSSKLQRANTVASGLGQDPTSSPVKGVIEKDGVSSTQETRRNSSTSLTSEKEDEEAQGLHHFCRGSIRRLRQAESKVSVAKRDMEEFLQSAKNESRGQSNGDLNGLDAMRLANDSRLAYEAQLEIRQIVRQFAELLQEEEDRVAVKADLLQRRSSKIPFDYSTPKEASGGEEIEEGDEEEETRDEQVDLDAYILSQK